MKKYYLPYGWLFSTRASKFDLFNIITIFINYSLASFLFLFLYFSSVDVWIFDYIIGFTGMMSLYECGYIFNDIVTIKYDDNPTYRIKNKDEIYAMPKHLENILTVRLLYFVLACYWINIHRPDNLVIYVVLCMGLLIAYAFHNFIRNGWNGFTFLAVVHFKYFIPIAVFLSFDELLHYYLWISAVAVFEQSVLRWSEKRYFSYNPVPEDKVDMFRVAYFGIVTLFFLIGIKFDDLELKFIGLPLFYFVYRLIGLYLSKNKLIKQMIHTRRTMHNIKE